MAAEEKQRRGIIRALVELDDSDVTTCAIQNLTWNKDREILIAVLNQGLKFSLEKRDNTGYTPLMSAVNLADYEIAQALLEAKASANVTDETKRSVVQLCALRCPNNRQKICLLLQKYGGRFCHDVFRAAYQGDMTNLHEAAVRSSKVESKTNRLGSLRMDSSGHTVAHYAAANGHLDYLKKIVSMFPEAPNIISSNGDTPLLLAAKNGHESCLEYLLQTSEQKTIKVTDKFGRDPLMCAARFGHTNLLKYLHEKKASLDRKSYRDAESPLTCAAYGGHIACIQYLLENGAYHDDTIRVPNQPASPTSIMLMRMGKGDKLKLEKLERGDDDSKCAYPTSRCNGGHLCDHHFLERARLGLMPLLYYALEKSELKISKWLHLHACAWENNLTRRLKHTAFMRAAVGGSLECLEWVSKHCNGSVQSKTVDGCSALHYAVVNDNLRVAQKLVKMGGKDTPDSQGNSLVLAAAKEGSLWCLQWLLNDMGGTIEAKNNSAQTPLLLAIAGGQVTTAKWLIGKKANVRAKDVNGHGLLLMAAKAGSVEMVRWLIEQKLGGGVGARDAVGRTPLILAASCNHLEVVQLLLEKKSDIRAMSICNLTPLLWASWLGCDKIVEYLLDKKAAVTDISLSGESALHLVAKCSHMPFALNTAKLLVKRGNSPTDLDSQGKSPAYVACLHGNLPLLKWLIGTGKASVSERDGKGLPMLFAASESKFLDVVKYLVSLNANLVICEGATEKKATTSSSPALLSSTSSSKIKDAALLHAVKCKRVAIVRYLVKVTDDPILELRAYKSTGDPSTRLAIDRALQNRVHERLKVANLMMLPHLLRLVSDYVSYDDCTR